MKHKPSKIEYIKIFSRVSRSDYNRLTEIKKKYGFKSNYEIVQYLMRCFLRVADPDKDTCTEPIPVEIEEMFASMTDSGAVDIDDPSIGGIVEIKRDRSIHAKIRARR